MMGQVGRVRSLDRGRGLFGVQRENGKGWHGAELFLGLVILDKIAQNGCLGTGSGMNCYRMVPWIENGIAGRRMVF
jgi:hypothetical protein